MGCSLFHANAPLDPASSNRRQFFRPAVTWELQPSGDRLTGTQTRGGVTTPLTGVRAPELKREFPKAWTKPEPSPAVAALAGVGGFQRWRHGAVALEVTDAQHPICAGLPPTIRLEDETYWPPTPALAAERVRVLAASREQTKPGGEETASQPMFWTYERGQGRVFGCVPGHYSWTFDDPYFRLLLLRGVAWAAHESPHRLDDLVLRSAAVAE